MSVFLTNPDNPNAREQLKGDIDFKMDFEDALVEMGIPLYYARLATIDHKDKWIPCFKKKLTAKQTANLLLQDIKKSYHLNKKKKRSFL